MTVGFDNLPVNFQLLVGIPMREAVGALAYDRARPHHTVALVDAPVWTQHALSNLTHLDFTPNDYGDSPHAADIDFAPANPFTLACWVNPDDLSAIRGLICKANGSTMGYELYIAINGAIYVVTFRAGPVTDSTFSAAAEITTGTWWFVTATYDGSGDCLVYKNGRNVTDTAAATHAPAASGEPLHIACLQTGTGPVTRASHLDGKLWNPRIWSRALPSIEIWEIFEMERALFDV